MRFVFIILLFASLSSYAQTKTTEKFIPDSEIDKRLKEARERHERLDTLNMEMIKRMQAEELERTLKQNNRNLENFMADHQAMMKKKEKGLWIRGGILLLSIGILIFALVNKKRKAVDR